MELGQLADYFGAMVKGIPLLLIVVGLVEYIKKAGATGTKLLVWSMVIGLLLGVGFMLTQERPPVGDWWPIFTYWFGNVAYGLGLGIVASGLYDTVKGILKPKAAAPEVLVRAYTTGSNPADNDPLP